MSSVYIVIPVTSITQAMINRSVNKQQQNMRSNADATMSVVEVEEPVPSIFDAYRWYTADEITEILQGESWQG